MLVLTRNTGEALCIGDDILITVLGVRGNQVRIGIEAPKDIPVNREEIYAKLKANGETRIRKGVKNGNL